MRSSTRLARYSARTLTPLFLIVTLVAGGGTAYAANDPDPSSPPDASTAISGLTARSTYRLAPPPGQQANDYSCAASYRRQGVETWVSVRNTSPTMVTGWTLTWALPDSQPIGAIWNAALVSHTGGTVTTRDLGWNANLAPGVEVTIGYLASGVVPPSGFALNGLPCQVR